jgi:probable phosphoglycerate mutase
MQRARETCEIAGYASVAIVDPSLMEWNYGESEGKTTAEMRAKYGPDWSVWTNEIVGGESVEQVGERADRMIGRALASVAIGPDAGESFQVALFAHAHILRILAARWIGLPPVDGKMFALGTGSLSVLGFEREQRVISRWNRSFEE